MDKKLLGTAVLFGILMSSALFLSTNVNAQVDTTPPELIAYDYSPKTIDVSTSPQTINYSIQVTDNLTGVARAEIVFQSPSGQKSIGLTGVLVSGDPRDGIWGGSRSIPMFIENGTWHISLLYIEDVIGNGRVFYEPELIALGFPTQLKIAITHIVDIDIKPGSSPNSINPNSKSKIPVAILSTKDFDAPRQVDPNSLTFGRTGDEKSLAFCTGARDVNGDGLPDLVCHFYTQNTSLQCGDTVGTLKGKTKDGTPIGGSDSVIIVPCK